ncbi:MAG: EscU/YscU/HrcU family type III secretion system export apparatus switch protein [Candidatus Eremiobacteraeota bacterium]|nr:EscU/YscU/HrcU family type III secretion system export apparatus switch protein [Candidatus Eremiobacteraeota bacterium]
MKDWRYDFRKKIAPQPAAAALRYDPVGSDPPELIAAGRGLIAEEIVRVAKEHNIALHEDAGLIEALSRLDLSEHIPRELYAVVAEVLAYVFRVDSATKSANRNTESRS